MKSPTSRFGIIDSEGMRKGSARKERSTSTNSSTGNSERE
jgi:hypothetical protein